MTAGAAVKPLFALAAGALLAVCGVFSGCAGTPRTHDAQAAAPTAAENTPAEAAAAPAEPRDTPEIDAAIERGVGFLVGYQNPDGSWGSATQTKGLNIYAPVPGAHQGFRAAVTSLCISALIETGGRDPAVLDALKKAERWMLENLPRVRRANQDAIYNVWAHAYAIQALVRMIERKAPDAPRRAELAELVRGQIDRLDAYEFVGGGWGYYNFDFSTDTPSGNTNSFTTATVLIALKEARRAGFDVPDGLVERGMAVIRRQRRPDFTYLYSSSFRFYTGRSINRPGGSLGRSQACNAATRMWGDEAVTDDVLASWLDRLVVRNGWLSMGRKRPVPHESHFAVAGYFYYYGHYYAGYCIQLLPPDRRPPHQKRIAEIIIGHQESDGSWWDYPLYNYHKPYGTAFALMTLQRCRPEFSQSPFALRSPANAFED